MRRRVDVWFAPVAVGFGIATAWAFGLAVGAGGKMLWFHWVMLALIIVAWPFTVRMYGRAREAAGKSSAWVQTTTLMEAHAYDRAQLIRERDQARRGDG